jgi:hypothetical protein
LGWRGSTADPISGINREELAMVETSMSGPRPADPGAAAQDSGIRPFRVSFPEEDLVELGRRIQATRWPEPETVDDDSQGVPLATMQALARHWAADDDWRRCEAKLNALPQFTTELDGLEIHFLHLRSPHQDALPLIVTHGCPGTPSRLPIPALIQAQNRGTTCAHRPTLKEGSS